MQKRIDEVVRIGTWSEEETEKLIVAKKKVGSDNLMLIKEKMMPTDKNLF